MSTTTKESIGLYLKAATTILVALCLWVLSDVRTMAKENQTAMLRHLTVDPTVHETKLQKDPQRREAARSVIKEWDAQVNARRWDALNKRLDRIEDKVGGG